ncbi:hypothetical protein B0H17DRAFT_926895, partial [Mycena rosella]
RLFTSKLDANNEDRVEFHDRLDPTGDLEKLKTDQLIHSQDNVVRYYKCDLETESESVSAVTYPTAIPGMFKIGDIVEMQASLITRSTCQHKIKVMCRLHVLTLLDNSFTRV